MKQLLAFSPPFLLKEVDDMNFVKNVYYSNYYFVNNNFYENSQVLSASKKDMLSYVKREN